MNDAHRHAHKAIELVNHALRTHGLHQPSARMFSTVRVAHFDTQEDLDFFKSAWSLAEYREAAAELVRLAKIEGLRVDTSVTMTRKGFEAGPFKSKFDYMLASLGLNDGKERDEPALGLRPMVLISQPQSSRSLFKTEQKFEVY